MFANSTTLKAKYDSPLTEISAEWQALLHIYQVDIVIHHIMLLAWLSI